MPHLSNQAGIKKSANRQIAKLSMICFLFFRSTFKNFCSKGNQLNSPPLFFPPNKIAEKKTSPNQQLTNRNMAFPEAAGDRAISLPKRPRRPQITRRNRQIYSTPKEPAAHFREIRPDPRRERANARSDPRASNGGRI